MTTTRENMHTLVDRLPECEIQDTYLALLELLARHHPVLRPLLKTLEDDREETKAKQAAIANAYAEVTRGEKTVTDKELRGKLGL